MKYTDWRIRGNQSYKNLDEQRQDDEKSRKNAGNTFMRSGGGILLAVALGVIMDNLPDSFSGAFIAVTLTVLFSVLAFSIGVIVYRRAKRKQDEAGEYDMSYSQSQRSQSEGRYTANTSSNRDYSGNIDSWDIKDPKPPWEL